MKQYSKCIVRQMITVWFVGAAFGGVVIVIELIAALTGPDSYAAAVPVHLPELLTYLGTPVGGGVVGYLLKSAFENREKIRNNFPTDYDDDPP